MVIKYSLLPVFISIKNLTTSSRGNGIQLRSLDYKSEGCKFAYMQVHAVDAGIHLFNISKMSNSLLGTTWRKLVPSYLKGINFCGIYFCKLMAIQGFFVYKKVCLRTHWLYTLLICGC